MKNIKTVVIGDGCVGKTTLLVAYTSGIFDQTYIPTVFDNYTGNVSVGGQIYQLNLWDTAGQEEYDSLRYLSYANTDVFILCFSLVEPNSFANIKTKWMAELKNYNMHQVPLILVGTKVDLRNNSNVLQHLANKNKYPVTSTMGQNLAKEISAVAYIECSALQQINLKRIFEQVICAANTHPIQPSNCHQRKSAMCKCVIV